MRKVAAWALGLLLLGTNVWAMEKETKELWSGSIYTSTFRFGICYTKSGQARGVLHLTTLYGQTDEYHFYGQMKNGSLDLRHSSGHHAVGEIIAADRVKGTITLGTGRKVNFKGKRAVGVSLTDDCAPR